MAANAITPIAMVASQIEPAQRSASGTMIAPSTANVARDFRRVERRPPGSASVPSQPPSAIQPSSARPSAAARKKGTSVATAARTPFAMAGPSAW